MLHAGATVGEPKVCGSEPWLSLLSLSCCRLFSSSSFRIRSSFEDVALPVLVGGTSARKISSSVPALAGVESKDTTARVQAVNAIAAANLNFVSFTLRIYTMPSVSVRNSYIPNFYTIRSYYIATATMSPLSADLSGQARIIDGDTIWIGDTKIRLHGIDAPETRQECTG